MTQAISVEYKKKRLRIARTFVSWLAEKGLILLRQTQEGSRRKSVCWPDFTHFSESEYSDLT